MPTYTRPRPEDDFATQAGTAIREKLAAGAAGIAENQRRIQAESAARAAATPGPRITGQGNSPLGRFVSALHGPSPTPVMQRQPAIASPTPGPSTRPTGVTRPALSSPNAPSPAATGAPAPVSTPPAATSAPPALVRPDGVMQTRDANGNNVYTGTGTVVNAAAQRLGPAATPNVTVLPSAATAQNAGQAYRSFTAPQVNPVALAGNVASNQRGQTLTARSDAASLLNPNSQEGQILRRAIDTATSRELRGYRSAREQIVGQILGQLDAGNRASLAGQGASNDAFAAGAAQAVEGDLQQQGQRADLVRDQVLQRGQERIARIQRPELTSDAQGRLLQVDGTSATPVTDAQGEGIRAPQAASAGQITPKDVLDTLNDQLASTIDPAERSALQQQIAGLIGGQGQGQAAGKPSAQQWLAQARQANPNVSDEYLMAYYNQNYGAR